MNDMTVYIMIAGIAVFVISMFCIVIAVAVRRRAKPKTLFVRRKKYD